MKNIIKVAVETSLVDCFPSRLVWTRQVSPSPMAGGERRGWGGNWNAVVRFGCGERKPLWHGFSHGTSHCSSPWASPVSSMRSVDYAHPTACLMFFFISIFLKCFRGRSGLGILVERRSDIDRSSWVTTNGICPPLPEVDMKILPSERSTSAVSLFFSVVRSKWLPRIGLNAISLPVVCSHTLSIHKQTVSLRVIIRKQQSKIVTYIFTFTNHGGVCGWSMPAAWPIECYLFRSAVAS